jgi:hypothetical protein
MKITVIQKASSAKPSGWCPVYVDDNPMAAKK